MAGSIYIFSGPSRPSHFSQVVGKSDQFFLKHALGAIEKLIGYKALGSRYRWNRTSLREQFERLPGRKGVWVDRTREGFLRKWKETRSLSARYQSIKALRDVSYGVLFASTEEQALERLRALRQSRKYPVSERRKVVAFLKRHWERFMMHHRIRGLPRTINLIENVNKQLERRFKTIEGFQHRSTAIGYVNLLIAYLRYKLYTDCRGKRKYLNGQSRLEAAGVHHDRTSWIRQCLKSA